MDITVGTDKKLLFQWGAAPVSFRVDVTSSPGDTFEITNIEVRPVQGRIRASNIGPFGTEVNISSQSDVNAQGYYGGLFGSQKQVGLLFDTNGLGQFTEELAVGIGSGKEASGFQRVEHVIGQGEHAQTVGLTGHTFILGTNQDNEGRSLLIMITGVNADGSKLYKELVHVAIRDAGAVLTIVGEDVLSVTDEFAGISTAFAAGAGNTELHLNITGVSGETIEWIVTAQTHRLGGLVP